MWSSEKSSNGQIVLSTEAALLFQDIHVRNRQSMEKLPDTIGAVLMATFGPRLVNEETYSRLILAPNTYSNSIDKLEELVAGQTSKLFMDRKSRASGDYH
jgi:hypothetical protein